ncbi:efflux RND transporter periplasmic adaptor subunit [Ochrobactrum sp. AN78]|uniref:efflux RND transporter periplasmic adaptor subunit n=1 Tax=Ochrobactrum sp. AN78 TaxID=3039853 RepID=UPI002989B0D5|nr:efflux RND transporter periplasmic adaptor subunit [Ochrobactrum sp. AN78]MDH7793138.1 membrane fusion protein (multidrug efflux system) [Ochrobactrum sp. AN78]
MTRALVHQNLKGALLLAVLIIASASAGKAQQPPAAPVPAVVVETVAVASAAAPQRFNGQIEAIEAVDIQARITGFLKGKAFEQGARIKAGDLLFEIEPDALQAALTLAQAQLARATANQNATRQTLSRTRTLASRNTASQAALDDAQAAFDIASADVQGAEANLNIARLNLSYTKIRSPINGTIGRSLVTLGNLVGPGSGPLARIVQLDPVRVVFSITDRALVSLRQQEAAGQAINPHQFSLNLVLANGTTYSQRGTLQFIDNEVSAQTGTVAVRALFANPDQILVPGQVVAVQLVDEAIGTLPVVPMSSVLQDRQGKYVFVLGTDNKVSRRPIVTGARIGNRWAVTSGVTQGEQIVTQGLQRIADQQLVAPREAIEDGGADQ